MTSRRNSERTDNSDTRREKRNPDAANRAEHRTLGPLHSVLRNNTRMNWPIDWICLCVLSVSHCVRVHRGSFAVVKRAVRKSDGKQFAVKVIKKSKLNSEELAVVHDEVEIMHRVRNTSHINTDRNRSEHVRLRSQARSEPCPSLPVPLPRLRLR